MLIQHLHNIQPTCIACNEPLKYIQESQVLFFGPLSIIFPYLLLSTCTGKNVSFSKESRPALEPNKSPFRWVPGFIPKT